MLRVMKPPVLELARPEKVPGLGARLTACIAAHGGVVLIIPSHSNIKAGLGQSSVPWGR